ncbi:MAG: response regulator [Dehalococcoidales bacterium]|nr:response regulator [Dehalococcoidales bacterium]
MTEKALKSRTKTASGKVARKKPVTKKEKEKILIIDDEPAFVESCRRIMEAKTYKVFTTSDREHAMEIMASEPDVIVLGTLAPAGQTFAMYKWLEKHPRYKDIPILVIDARQEEQNIRGLRTFENIQVDGDEYLAKPIEPVSLVPRIRSLIDAKTKTIKILVVDDHTMIRTGISAVIALQKDMEVISEAVNGQDAVDKVMRFSPHVALVDIFMPVMSGIEATKVISEKYPETKVLILTQYDEEENMIVAKQSGAFGFIPKKAASSDLVRGIRYVSQGRYFPSEFAELVVN